MLFFARTKKHTSCLYCSKSKGQHYRALFQQRIAEDIDTESNVSAAEDVGTLDLNRIRALYRIELCADKGIADVDAFAAVYTIAYKELVYDLPPL